MAALSAWCAGGDEVWAQLHRQAGPISLLHGSRISYRAMSVLWLPLQVMPRLVLAGQKLQAIHKRGRGESCMHAHFLHFTCYAGE